MVKTIGESIYTQHKRSKYDITGNRYGRLMVLGFAYSVKKNGSYWNCQCDCGVKKTIRRDGLVSRKVISCGCYNREVATNSFLDLTGCVFGRLIVKERTEIRNNSGRVKWLCLCSCGNECLVTTACLRIGHTKSCGCLQREAASIQGFKNAKNGTGITLEHEALRHRVAYKEWRQMVFERDDFICAKCGLRGGTLNSHHIISFSVNEKLRLKMDNGITLCKKCHQKFHSEYGKKQYNNTSLNKFLN